MIELETKLAKNKLLKSTLSILLKKERSKFNSRKFKQNDFILETYDQITLNSISLILVG